MAKTCRKYKKKKHSHKSKKTENKILKEAMKQDQQVKHVSKRKEIEKKQLQVEARHQVWVMSLQ